MGMKTQPSNMAIFVMYSVAVRRKILSYVNNNTELKSTLLSSVCMQVRTTASHRSET
jgi:hypothetical protein